MAWYRCGTGIPPSVNNMKTLSSASGSIATFDTDLTDNLVKCVADIDADATGFTSVGVHLLKGGKITGGTIYHRSITTSDTWAANTSARSMVFACETNTEYTITGYSDQITVFRIGVLHGSLPSGTDSANLYNVDRTNGYADIGKSYTYTTDSEATYIVVQVSADYAQDFKTNGYVGESRSLSIALGETLTQGGSLDVISGLLTRTDTTTKQLTGGYLSTYSGINNILADTGDIDVTYLETVGHKIS